MTICRASFSNREVILLSVHIHSNTISLNDIPKAKTGPKLWLVEIHSIVYIQLGRIKVEHFDLKTVQLTGTRVEFLKQSWLFRKI